MALHEGPSLVFLTEPRFALTAQKGRGDVTVLHPQSPAGLFIRKHKDYFAQFDISFEDPFKGLGGLGASTAQFLGVYALWLYKESQQQDMEKILDFKHILDSYYEVAWDGTGLRPSGADLVGQLKGALTFFEKRQGLISVKNWPFSDLEFYLVRTGKKVATHEHLRTLKVFDSSGLETAFALLREGFNTSDSDLFVEGINSYAQQLKKLDFTCESTLSILQDLRGFPGVRGVKGCGALGADVILVLTKKDFAQGLQQYCHLNGLDIFSSHLQISSGLQVRGHL